MLIWRLGLNEEPLAMIRLVSFCYRRASVTLLASLFLLWMSDSHFIRIFRAFPAHQTATFLAVLASTILYSDVVRLPTWCRTNWISVCRASFTGSRRPTVLSGYLFSTHTFLCINKSKIYSSVLFVELSSDARLSLPGRPTLQGMWTYLCAFRENLPKGTKKSVTEVRLKLTTLWLGPRCSILLSYPAKLGWKYLKNTPYLPL